MKEETVNTYWIKAPLTLVMLLLEELWVQLPFMNPQD